MKISDNELLHSLLRHDEQSFRSFYEQTREPLLKYLQKYLDRDDAEEVLHDTYIAFIEGLRNFRGQSTLKTYIYSIGKRKAIDKLRRRKVKKILFSYLPDGIVDSLAKVFLKDDVDKKILAYKIEKIFNKLPHDYAVILRLKYKEDYSVIEIAKQQNISFKSAESLLYRARQAFVKEYNQNERQTIHTIKEALR